MYSLISTFPKNASRNVGDLLITESTKKIIAFEKGINEFDVYFRTENLEKNISAINSSRALIIPCLAIRNKMFPTIFSFSQVWEKIQVPVIPITSGLFVPPQQSFDFMTTKYNIDSQTISQLKKFFEYLTYFPCRDALTYSYLKKQGFENVFLSGDVALFDPDFFGKQFPNNLNLQGTIAITEGHFPDSYSQLFNLVERLKYTFTKARIVFISHAVPHQKQNLIKILEKYGVEIYDASGDVDKLSVYDQCSIHIGYRIHAHVSCLRRRIPSILLSTDSRGMGYGRTINNNIVFQSFCKEILSVKDSKTIIKMLLKTGRIDSFFKARFRNELLDMIFDFLQIESENGWSSYANLGAHIDLMYAQLKKVIDIIP